MRNIVAELRAEHANMAQLLDILEAQIQAFEAGGETDYTLILDVITYFLEFPDQCHHPKEDILAQTLLSLVPDSARKLRGLGEMHEELGALTRRVAETVNGVVHGIMMPRVEVTRLVSAFIGSQRQHMAMEEQHFLPLADEVLTAADLRALDAEIFDREDPLFSADTAERFVALHAEIIRWGQPT